MEVLLLEKIKKLGNVGDSVTVKDGYARNYLFTKNKVIRSTKKNKEKFQEQRKLIEKNNAEKKSIALQNCKTIINKNFSIIRQAGDDGRLYGSVNNKDIANILLSKFNIKIPVENIILHDRIKETGFYNIIIELYADIEAKIRLIVARSEVEAKNALEKEKSNRQKKITNKELENKIEVKSKTTEKINN